jgi:hypothetical protein
MLEPAIQLLLRYKGLTECQEKLTNVTMTTYLPSAYTICWQMFLLFITGSSAIRFGYRVDLSQCPTPSV